MRRIVTKEPPCSYRAGMVGSSVCADTRLRRETRCLGDETRGPVSCPWPQEGPPDVSHQDSPLLYLHMEK